MSNEKYKRAMGIISLALSSLAFLSSLGCMLGYILSADNGIVSIILLPLLIICVFMSAATSVAAFINFASRLGKIAFILSLLSIAFIVASFILLYR